MDSTIRHVILCISVTLIVGLCQASTTKDHPYSTPESDKYLIYTGPDINKDDNVLHVEGLLGFTFKLRACSEGHVFLRNSASTTGSYKATDVLIGGKDNTVTSIGKPTETPYVEVATPEVLHCSELRDFWVSWNKTDIHVGRGPTPGFQGLASAKWPDADKHDVLTATVSTGRSYAGTWEFDDDIGRGITINTPTGSSYAYLWRTVENRPNFLSFSVHACQDVSVGFGPKTGDNYYQVHFGIASGNTSIQIGDFTKLQEATSLGGYCQYSGALWVSWEGDQISAGTGLFPDRDPIINAAVTNRRTVGSVGFASVEAASWDFHSDTEEFYVFFTEPGPSNFTFENWLRAPLVQATTFFVESCDDVHLALARNTNDSDPRNTIITIGNAGDQGYVKIESNGKSNRWMRANNLLMCNVTRAFWITWREGTVMIGQGFTSGVRPIVTHKVDGVSENHVIGFGNGFADGATWLLHPLAGDEVIIVTQERVGPTGPHATSIPVLADYARTFKLQTPQEAKLSLGEGGSVFAIELTLAENNIRNTSVVLWTANGKVERKVCTHSSDVISETEALDYWISWRSGEFRFGLGQEPDRSGMGRCDNQRVPVPIIVRSIGVSTQARAEWTFPTEKKDEIVLYNYDKETAELYRWMKLKDIGKDWATAVVFQFKGSSGLEILFSPEYREEAGSTLIKFDAATITFQSGSGIPSIVNITGVLRGDIFVQFWVRRGDGNVLELGTGQLGQNSLGQFPIDGTYKFTGMAIKTATSTEFRVPVYLGSELSFTTAEIPTYLQVAHEVRDREALFFSILGCESKAAISLFPSESMGFTSDTYVIDINVDSVGIKKGTVVVVSRPLDDALSCEEERYYWILFGADGEFTLGRGSHEVLVNWYDLNPYPVHVVSFTNGYNTAGGDWRLRLDAGNKFSDADWIDHGKSSESSKGLSGGEIAGIVIGVLLLVAIIGFVILIVKSGVPAPLESAWSSVQQRFRGGSDGVTRLTEEQ